MNKMITLDEPWTIELGKDSSWSDNEKDIAKIYKIKIYSKKCYNKEYEYSTEIFVKAWHDGGFAYRDSLFPKKLEEKIKEEFKLEFEKPLGWTEQGQQDWEKPNPPCPCGLRNPQSTGGGLHISHLLYGIW